MCYIQVKNIRLNSFYEEKKIKLCLTKQLLNMFNAPFTPKLKHAHFVITLVTLCNKKAVALCNKNAVALCNNRPSHLVSHFKERMRSKTA